MMLVLVLMLLMVVVEFACFFVRKLSARDAICS
jgi:hypothetical protein